MISATDTVRAYFDAWNSQNPAAILDTFTEDGVYSDPVGGKNLSGEVYINYLTGMFTAFPDLRLELIANTVASNGMVAAPWLLFGTHQGQIGEIAPTQKTVTLPGCDFVKVHNGKIQEVIGYFDPDYLFDQLK